MIQAKNPDGSSDTYYSYMRAISLGASTQPLLAQTIPIFSLNPAFEAVVLPPISPQLNPNYFDAIALQNPGQISAEVTIEMLSPSDVVTGSTRLTLAPRNRIEREVSELFGATLLNGGYLHVVAAQPVQILGLVGNDTTGVVTPVIPSILSAPPVVPAGK
jgi:hypothetical protein